MWFGVVWSAWDSENFEVFADNGALWTNVPVRDSEDSEDSHGHEMRRGIAHVRHHCVYRLLFFCVEVSNTESRSDRTYRAT